MGRGVAGQPAAAPSTQLEGKRSWGVAGRVLGGLGTF